MLPCFSGRWKVWRSRFVFSDLGSYPFRLDGLRSGPNFDCTVYSSALTTRRPGDSRPPLDKRQMRWRPKGKSGGMRHCWQVLRNRGAISGLYPLDVGLTGSLAVCIETLRHSLDVCGSRAKQSSIGATAVVAVVVIVVDPRFKAIKAPTYLPEQFMKQRRHIGKFGSARTVVVLNVARWSLAAKPCYRLSLSMYPADGDISRRYTCKVNVLAGCMKMRARPWDMRRYPSYIIPASLSG